MKKCSTPSRNYTACGLNELNKDYSIVIDYNIYIFTGNFYAAHTCTKCAIHKDLLLLHDSKVYMSHDGSQNRMFPFHVVLYTWMKCAPEVVRLPTEDNCTHEFKRSFFDEFAPEGLLRFGYAIPLCNDEYLLHLTGYSQHLRPGHPMHLVNRVLHLNKPF